MSQPKAVETSREAQAPQESPSESAWDKYWASLSADQQEELQPHVEGARAWFTIGAVWGQPIPQSRLSPEAIPEQSREKLIERARAFKCSELGRDIYWNHESGACEFAADFYLRETEHGFAKLEELDWDVLTQAADYLNQSGGGPMEDRLRLLAENVREELRR